MTARSVQLWELAKLIRAKNAGPWIVTIDIMFDDAEAYDRVRRSGVISRGMIASLYGVEEDEVFSTEHDAAMALKISLPRRIACGGLGDTDVFGGQFHGPLVDLEIPEVFAE